MSQPRIEWLLERLAARTDGQGRPRSGFSENVAALKAELAIMQEKAKENEDGKSV